MATYFSPTVYPQDTRSKRIVIGGERIDTADDGSIRGRCFYRFPIYEFTIVHGNLSKVQAQEIYEFYFNNRGLPIDFVWSGDGNNYQGFMLGYDDTQESNSILWVTSIRFRARRQDQP